MTPGSITKDTASKPTVGRKMHCAGFADATIAPWITHLKYWLAVVFQLVP